MATKCACGNPHCKIKIEIEHSATENTVILRFTDKYDRESVMYLDPNSIANLVKELKEALLQTTFGNLTPH